MILTRGSPFGLPELFSNAHLHNDMITAVAQSDNSGKPVIGQIRCEEGRRNAQLTLIYPDHTEDTTALSLLLDGLAQYAGWAGSYGVLAEVNEMAPIFEVLRRAGYSVYGWQRIYRLPFEGKNIPRDNRQWYFASAEDEISIRQLFQSLVPPLAQAADPLPPGRLYGLIYRENDQIQAYFECCYGPDGIYLRPLIHPNVENIQALLRSLEGYLLPLLGRKVYLAVRSHQSWLESPLVSMKAVASERQALMVKHLASMQRKPILSVARSVIEDAGVKPTTPPMGAPMGVVEKIISHPPRSPKRRAK